MSKYVQHHRDELGQREVTVEKQWRYLKWFLDWATRKGYNTCSDYQRFRPKFKKTDKTIVFLDWKELMHLYKFQVPKSDTKVNLKTHDGLEYEKEVTLSGCLERVRDMFCFCCFTSLRYSDIRNLKPSDIVDGVINITTVKTHDKIAIELNKYSKSILEKYKDCVFPGGTVLPVISNQKMNDYLKELAELAGLNAPSPRSTIRTASASRRPNQNTLSYAPMLAAAPSSATPSPWASRPISSLNGPATPTTPP